MFLRCSALIFWGRVGIIFWGTGACPMSSMLQYEGVAAVCWCASSTHWVCSFWMFCRFGVIVQAAGACPTYAMLQYTKEYSVTMVPSWIYKVVNSWIELIARSPTGSQKTHTSAADGQSATPWPGNSMPLQPLLLPGMLQNLPEPSGSAAQFMFPEGDLVPCISLNPQKSSNATDACMQPMHDGTTALALSCWREKLKSMWKHNRIARNNKRQRYNTIPTVPNSKPPSRSACPMQGGSATAASSTVPPRVNGTAAAVPIHAEHASKRSPAMHALRRAMLCAVVMHEGIDSADMDLPSDKQVVGALRRAARMYNVQLSSKVLDASGLWPLDCLHEVRPIFLALQY